jgi:hypothetical protein
MSYDGTTTFDYTNLGCDYFPPILKAYYSVSGTYKQFDFATTTTIYGGDFIQFRNIGLGTCLFVNHIYGRFTTWKLIAYM